MTENTTEINNIFTAIASKYECLNTILTLNIDKMWRKRAIKLCHLKEGDHVLDLCCGTGQMIELACKIVGKETEVVGLDFNPAMIKVGKEKRKSSLKDYKFRMIQGNILELPFENNTFDCVTIAFGLRNIKDKRKALSEIYRVLKVGGKVVCLELSKPDILIVNNIYNIYFNHILPLIGYFGTRNKKAYYYLRNSVNSFMTKNELKLEFDTIGLKDAGYVSLTLGTASIHYGIKK